MTRVWINRWMSWKRAHFKSAGLIGGWLLFAHAAAQSAGPDAWTISQVDQRVQTLQHRLETRMPILAWQLPGVPMTDAAVTMRKTGVLQQNIRLLWSKGIAPTVNLSAVSQGTGTLRGAKALGATLEELQIPAHIYANPPHWMANWTVMNNGKSRHYPWDYWPLGAARWFEYAANFPGELWPVFPLASPDAGYAEFSKLFGNLKADDAAHGLPGVRSAAGLWMDYEDLPYPWNGARISQQQGVINGRPVASYYDDRDVPFPGKGQSVRGKYGADALTSNTAFLQYSTDLRTWLLDESARKAFLEAYGSATPTGYFGDVFSTRARPFYDLNGTAYPVKVELEPGKAAMPVLYANNRYLRKYLGGNSQPTANQASADEVYWHLMLKSFSSSAVNAGKRDRSVPWVAQYVREDLGGKFDYAMSAGLYKELLRHLWLRGAMGMYAFNPYDSKVDAANVYMTASHSLDELEHVRAVLDEMLCFRDFLERGVPMNFDYRPMFDQGPVWSGLARDGEAVIRVFSPNGAQHARIPQITVPSGATFWDVAVPPGGATYLLMKDGGIHRVDVRPAEAYLQMDENFRDSSGSRHEVTRSQVPASFSGADFVDEVAGGSVLAGAYGLYTNRANRQSLRLSRPNGSPEGGNSLVIAGQHGEFSPNSFTAELLIKIESDADPDDASIISKGRSADDMDWTLRLRRNKIGAGGLELGLARDSATIVYMQTAGAPLVAGRWHHIAIVYDAIRRSAQVYVDYEPQLWNANDYVSSSGVLNWDFKNRNEDRLVVGRFNRGITALVDEFRFTAEALEPNQFLRIGALQ